MKYLLEIHTEEIKRDGLHGYDNLDILKHHLEVNEPVRFCIWINTNAFCRDSFKRLTADEIYELIGM